MKSLTAAASGDSVFHELTSRPGAARFSDAMTPASCGLVGDVKGDLGNVAADAEHRLSRLDAGEGEGVLGGLVAGEEPLHLIGLLGEAAVGRLGHDDHPLADAGLEPAGEVSAEHDAGIGSVGEVAAVGNLARNDGDLPFAGRIDTVEGERQRLVFALHDGRNARARHPGIDRRVRERRFQGAGRRRHAARHGRIVEKALGVDLAAAGQKIESGVAARLCPGIEQRGEDQDRIEPDGDDDERDDRAPRIAPQIAPGERPEELQRAHHAALMAATGSSRLMRRTGNSPAIATDRMMTAGPIVALRMLKVG